MMNILNVKTRENSHDIHVNLWRVFCFILFYFILFQVRATPLPEMQRKKRSE